jgi:hypothetical protein
VASSAKNFAKGQPCYECGEETVSINCLGGEIGKSRKRKDRNAAKPVGRQPMVLRNAQ